MIHCFAINNCHIALDVNSGAVHVLDDLAYGILTENIPNKYNEQQINDAKAEIEMLISKGQLHSKERDKTKEITFTQNREPVVKALCMHIAHDCNLRCKYCFAGEGDYGAIKRSLMSADIGKKSIDFLIAHSGKRRNLEVDFFGGEPTLNFNVVKEIVEYARNREAEAGKKFRFTLTTNGLLLDSDKIDYINQQMDNVVLSLDGRREVNDKMRKSPSKSRKNADDKNVDDNDKSISCYDRVLPKFKELVEARYHENYYIRGTYTRENLDFSNDVLHIAELGFKQISVEPVIAPPSADYSIRQEDIPILCHEYEKLAIEMSKRQNSELWPKFNFFHFMIDMSNGPCAAKRITGCGAGSEYLAVTPEGDLYPCHQFVGDPKFKLGDINTGFLPQQVEWREKFSHMNIYTKPECDDCWAKYFCSGGCAANAYHLNGDIAKPDVIGCELQKKRLECALYLLCSPYSQEGLKGK